MKIVEVNNDLYNLIMSVYKSKPDWECPYHIASLFSYHRDRRMAAILTDIRRLTRNYFEGEPRSSYVESLSRLNSAIDIYLIELNLEMDQLANLAYSFYAATGKTDAPDSDYFYSLNQFVNTIRKNGIDNTMLEILGGHEYWLQSSTKLRNLIVHRLNYSDADFDGPTKEFIVTYYGMTRCKITSCVKFVSITYYGYRMFIRDLANHFKEYLSNELDNFLYVEMKQEQTDSYLWRSLDFFFDKGKSLVGVDIGSIMLEF